MRVDDMTTLEAREEAHKNELKASLRPKRIAADRVAAIVGPLEQELGRPLSADERRVFCAAVEQ